MLNIAKVVILFALVIGLMGWGYYLPALPFAPAQESLALEVWKDRFLEGTVLEEPLFLEKLPGLGAVLVRLSPEGCDGKGLDRMILIPQTLVVKVGDKIMVSDVALHSQGLSLHTVAFSVAVPKAAGE